ncbi:hypothetical protein NC653_000894 [Populus alba x Populus x berolinensis]|uniref:Retrotransposon gag domain-containing protein n=1 Tax=Populus alba x Populus x berolinensis TaxID=444605 RepID=A0AAD6RJP4_9ROSI|nr:hypothetical protein NC653_000894 [Populus alba x Populus x berolinensis]
MDLTNEDPHDFKFSNHEGDDKWTALEERLRAIKGNDLFDPIRAAKDSLTGSALSWYMRLDNIRIKKWTDLADAFLKQYKFNLEIAPDRTSLTTMEKGTQESVRVYAQRWRDQAINVQPPLIETEMVTLFANTFRAPYYEHLMGSSAQHFYDVVRIVERIEQGIRSGRIAEPIEKRGFIGKKKENEVNNLERRSKNYQIPTPQVTSINFAKTPIPNQPNQIKFPVNNQSNYQRKDNQPSEEQLPPLPITLKELYAKLLSIGQIAPLPVPPMQPPFPTWYNPEVICEYHAGHAGHSIEACFAFKRKVLQLIKVGWITFEDSPNKNSNPLPKHVASRGGVNNLEIGSKERVLKMVSGPKICGTGQKDSGSTRRFGSGPAQTKGATLSRLVNRGVKIEMSSIIIKVSFMDMWKGKKRGVQNIEDVYIKQLYGSRIKFIYQRWLEAALMRVLTLQIAI